MFRDRGNPNLPRHALWRPGMDWDAIGRLDPHVKHPATEGASDPHARLADTDAMGVDHALLYPTWFAEGFFPGARFGPARPADRPRRGWRTVRWRQRWRRPDDDVHRCPAAQAKSFDEFAASITLSRCGMRT